MTNKEAIDKLEEYFLTQDPRVVARCAAALMIDINRIDYLERLSDEEADCLWRRISLNARQVRKFFSDGTQEDLKYIVMNSDKVR